MGLGQRMDLRDRLLQACEIDQVFGNGEIGQEHILELAIQVHRTTVGDDGGQGLDAAVGQESLLHHDEREWLLSPLPLGDTGVELLLGEEATPGGSSPQF